MMAKEIIILFNNLFIKIKMFNTFKNFILSLNQLNQSLNKSKGIAILRRMTINYNSIKIDLKFP